MNKLTIVHLYPEEMNIYGDGGNVLALTKRLEWRGIDYELVPIGVGDDYDLPRPISSLVAAARTRVRQR